MTNALLALQALSGVLTLIEQSAFIVTQVKGALAKSRAEGRDVSSEELAEIMSQTDALHEKVKNRLQNL